MRHLKTKILAALILSVIHISARPLYASQLPDGPIAGIEFVFVKGGCYQMGDMSGDGNGSERPVHEVCVKDYYIGKFEVTQGQWKEVMGNNPSIFESCGDNCPVEQISWNDTQEFIRKLNGRGGFEIRPYRLPTEAEWEYAARSGGRSEKYPGGDDVEKVSWYNSNSGNKTHQVGTKAPNGLGLYDMGGNVWEWVQDWYGEKYYSDSPKNNPMGPESGKYRVLRSGSWSSNAKLLRSSNRSGRYPDNRNINLGFRLARNP